jgi:predicted flap endonuclease-1-like 5' DNA nuclease
VINVFLSMQADAVFAGVFLVLLVVTLVIPGLPPGGLLVELLGFPQAIGSSLGLLLAAMLKGAINGLLWGLVALAVFMSSDLGRGRKPLLSLPEAEKLPSPPPRAMPVDERVEKIPPAMTVREGRFRMDRDVKMIEGIGAVRGRLLNSMGVRTVDDLLKAGATTEGRARLATKVDVSYAVVLSWVNRGDLLRVRGVGGQYSGLLETAGVLSVRDLSTRTAINLWETLKRVNSEKKLVRRVPPLKTIETWVSNAARLAPIV